MVRLRYASLTYGDKLRIEVYYCSKSSESRRRSSERSEGLSNRDENNSSRTRPKLTAILIVIAKLKFLEAIECKIRLILYNRR